MTRRLVLPLVAVAVVASGCTSLQVAAATVNGAKIAESQVESELDRVRGDPNYSELLSRDQTRGEARRFILSGLIRQEILSQEAARLGIRTSPEQIDELINREAQRLGLGVEEFLELQNLSRADVEEIAGRLVREFELSRRVVDTADVPEDVVGRFYEQNATAFEEAELARITVATEADARGALERLGRTSFATVARELSIDPLAGEGGDMGYVPLSELSPQAQAAVRQVAEGRVTDPVPTETGFEIYRVLDKRTRPLGEVSDQIRAQLSEQTRTARFEEWVTTRMRAATVVVNPKYGRFDKDAAAVVTGQRELPE